MYFQYAYNEFNRKFLLGMDKKVGLVEEDGGKRMGWMKRIG